MYILDEFTFRERPDLAINHEGEFESIIAEIEPKQAKKECWRKYTGFLIPPNGNPSLALHLS